MDLVFTVGPWHNSTRILRVHGDRIDFVEEEVRGRDLLHRSAKVPWHKGDLISQLITSLMSHWNVVDHTLPCLMNESSPSSPCADRRRYRVGHGFFGRRVRFCGLIRRSIAILIAPWSWSSSLDFEVWGKIDKISLYYYNTITYWYKD